MENNAYKMEEFEQRLDRFKQGSPDETILTLLSSIHNCFNNEIKITVESYQTGLLFLGIHAVALTVAYYFWKLDGESGYQKFLKEFIDGEEKGFDFSKIAKILHRWRNIIAHQWLSCAGHSIKYDYKMDKGFVFENDYLTINPSIYCDCYLKAFSSGGKIWEYKKLFSEKELEEIKNRIIRKYEKLQQDFPQKNSG